MSEATSGEYLEQLRRSLLRFLSQNSTRWGLPTGYLRAVAAAEGRPELDARRTELELEYLVEKGLAAGVQKVVSPELRCWRITAEGRDYLSERNQ